MNKHYNNVNKDDNVDRNYHYLTLWLLGLTSFLSFFNFCNSLNIPKVVKESILEHEYDKVGGKENYELINRVERMMLSASWAQANLDAYKQAYKELSSQWVTPLTNKNTKFNPSDFNYSGELNVDGIKTTPTGTGTTTTNNTTTDTSNTQKTEIKKSSRWLNILPDDEFKKVTTNGIFSQDVDSQGKFKGKILVIEYADLECPYCITQHNDNQVIQKLKSEYGNLISYTFKNHLGVNHPNTKQKALVGLCIAVNKWPQSYDSYVDQVFKASKVNNNIGMDGVKKIALWLGITEDQYNSCLNDSKLNDLFMSTTNEATNLGLQGTPSTLMVNLDTKEALSLQWAYSYEAFKWAIDTLKNENTPVELSTNNSAKTTSTTVIEPADKKETQTQTAQESSITLQ